MKQIEQKDLLLGGVTLGASGVQPWAPWEGVLYIKSGNFVSALLMSLCCQLLSKLATAEAFHTQTTVSKMQQATCLCQVPCISEQQCTLLQTMLVLLQLTKHR